MSGAAGRKVCLLFLASWGELKKMASRFYAKQAYSQWSVNSDTRLHPPLEFPSRSLLSQTTLRCRLLRSLLSQTTLRCRLLRARSPGFTRTEIRFFLKEWVEHIVIIVFCYIIVAFCNLFASFRIKIFYYSLFFIKCDCIRVVSRCRFFKAVG